MSEKVEPIETGRIPALKRAAFLLGQLAGSAGTSPIVYPLMLSVLSGKNFRDCVEGYSYALFMRGQSLKKLRWKEGECTP